MTRVPNTRDPLVRHYDYAFGFDWSNGHDRKKPDALDIKDMRKEPSANARHMRESKIESKDYLGEHEHDLMLRVGDVQQMQFNELNHLGEEQCGPRLWSEQKRQHRHSIVNGMKQVKKLKDDLMKDLAKHNMLTKGTVKQLEDRCAAAGISLEKPVKNVTQQGFIGLPKGMYEILWERGFIDPNVPKYTIDGVVDPATGRIDPKTSLKHLIQQLPDFENEKSLLHYHGEKLGCIVFNSPKCTPEVAGEGVEYDWGVSKLWYRTQDIALKKKRSAFRQLVLRAISKEVLSLRMTRDNTKRAREHMMSYYKLEKSGGPGAKVLPSDVQKMMKTRKTHSCVVDMEKGFFSFKLRAMAAANQDQTNA
jgi:hypothetical protein